MGRQLRLGLGKLHTEAIEGTTVEVEESGEALNQVNMNGELASQAAESEDTSNEAQYVTAELSVVYKSLFLSFLRSHGIQNLMCHFLPIEKSYLFSVKGFLNKYVT